MIEIIESRESSDLLKFRTLLALRMIVKSIASKVLLNSRSQFQISTETSLPFLINLFSNSLSPILNLITSFLTLINNENNNSNNINNNNNNNNFAYINTNNLTNLYLNNNPQFYQTVIEKNQNIISQLNEQLQSLKLAAEISQMTLKTIIPMIIYAISFVPASVSFAKQSSSNINNEGGESPRSKSQRVANLALKFLHDLSSSLNLFILFRSFYYQFTYSIENFIYYSL